MRQQRKDFGGGTSSPVQEGVPKGVELPERLFGVHYQSIARNGTLVFTVHHRNEAVGGGLGSNPHPWEVLLQQIPGLKKQTDRNMKNSATFPNELTFYFEMRSNHMADGALACPSLS